MKIVPFYSIISTIFQIPYEVVEEKYVFIALPSLSSLLLLTKQKKFHLPWHKMEVKE